MADLTLRRDSPQPSVGSARVTLIGFGLVGQAAIRALRAGGVHDVQVNDRAEAARQGDTPAHDAHAPPANGDIRLLCADVVDPHDALALNARCLADGVSLIPGLVMGSVGQVGPDIDAGRTACLQCVDLRLRATTGRSCLGDYGPADPRVAAHVGEELARRALALRAGGVPQPDLSFHWPDGSVTRHGVLRTWHCAHCGGAAPPPGYGPVRPPGVSPSRHRILELEAALVDPVVGPIRALDRYEPGSTDPRLHHWVASLADPGWAECGSASIACGGNDMDSDRARAAALGEAVERMSSCCPAPAGMLTAPYGEVMHDAVDPRAWDLFDAGTRARAGFPYAEATPEETVSWTLGWSLARGRPVLVPAARVFVPFRPRTPADDVDPILSGFATGETFEQATLAAVLEVVERDALMIAWANRLSPPRLALDRSSPGGVGPLVAAFEDARVPLRCCVLQLDIAVPTVVAMGRGAHPGDPAIVVAAAAGLDTTSACRRAITELAANRIYVRATAAARYATGFRNDDQTDHGVLYARPEMAGYLAPWWDSPAELTLDEAGRRFGVAGGLRGLVDAISTGGLETIVVDITPSEIRQLGLSVAKALVPGAHPLDDRRWPRRGGRRLRAAPVRAGLLERPRAPDELNPLPHPLP